MSSASSSTALAAGLRTRTGKTAWSITGLPQPALLATHGSTAFVVAGGDDNGNDRTLYALRLSG